MNHTKRSLSVDLEDINQEKNVVTKFNVDLVANKPTTLLSPLNSNISKPCSKNCSPYTTPHLPFTHSPISRNSSMQSRRNSLTEHLELPRLNTWSPNSRNSSRPDSRNSFTPNTWAYLGADSRDILNISTDSGMHDSFSETPEYFKSCLNINDNEEADKIISAIESGILDPKVIDLYGRTYLMALMCPKTIVYKDISIDKRLIILNKLLVLGADINATENLENRAPLHYAAQYRNLTMLKWLYKNQADFSKRLINGNTVIHEAILGKGVTLKTESNIVEIIKFCLMVQPNLINMQGICQLSPLELSIQYSRKQTEEHLRTYKNINLYTLSFSNDKETHPASPNNTYKINYRQSNHSIITSKNNDPIIQLKINILFKQQKDFEIYFNQNKLIFGRDDEILELLVFCLQQKKLDQAKFIYKDTKYNINYADIHGLTIIEYAIRYKWYDFFNEQSGLTKDYDFDKHLKKGMTAAMVAARYSNEQMIKIIVERGSNLMHKDDKGRNVFAHATSTLHNTETNASKGRCLEILIEKKLNFNEIKVN